MEKIEKGNPLSQSADIVKENIDLLKQLFPTIVKEGKIDFNELKALLDEEIETNEEYYRFSWAGKSEARREANKQSTATLRPNKLDSKNWDTTGNIFIEGDNLEVLKLLQKSYAGEIKMIYFDPPYNTGKDFVYKDDYADNLGNYLSQTHQLDELGKNKSTNPESDGRYHSNWLNMMYPRLKLAHNLLTDYGVLFISIDDHEVINLRKLCDEVFGVDNFIAQIMPISNPGGRDYNQIAVTHEYLLCYAKTDLAELNEIKKEADFKFSDNRGGYNMRELRNRNPRFHSGNRPNLFYSFFVNPNIKDEYGYCSASVSKTNEYTVDVKPYNSEGKESVWRWGKPRSFENIVLDNPNESQVLAKQKSDGGWNIYEKNRRSTTKVKSIWDETFMRTEEGTRLIRHLFGISVFDHPKSLHLIKRIVEIGSEDGIVLDFFAGSGTTAHAVMQQNIEDGSNRKFICVQLPEFTDEKSEAYKAGYKTIADLCIARIQKSGEQIILEKTTELNKLKKSIEGKIFQKETQEQIDLLQLSINNIDIGFKAFKLDSSNILAWDGSVENLERNLLNAEINIKEDRSEEDVLFEILIKYGLDLTVPIKENEFNSCKVYSIGGGVLLICLSDNITTEIATYIGKWKEELQPATCRALFKDNGFNDDIAKTNSMQILRQYGIEEVNSI